MSIYFRSTITSKKFAMETLHKLYEVSAEKYVVCCQDSRMFLLSTGVMNDFVKNIDMCLV